MGRESMSFCDLLCLRSWIYIKKKYVFLKHETKCFSTVCKGSENQLTIK